MGYVATQHIRFGDKILEPGEEVPFEQGRNYGAMLRRNEIAVVHNDPSERASRGRKDAESEPAEDKPRRGRPRKADASEDDSQDKSE